MQLVAAAAGDHVDLPARVTAVLGTVAVGRDLELLDRVHGRLQRIPVNIRVVVVDSIQQEVVVFLASAVGVHGEIAARGKLGILHRRQNTGREQSQLQEVPLLEWQAVDLAAFHHLAEFGGLGRQLAHLCRDRNRFAFTGNGWT